MTMTRYHFRFHTSTEYICFLFSFHFFFSALQSAEGNINDVLIKTLAEAHANTNLKLEYVHEMFRKPQVIFYQIYYAICQKAFKNS